MAAIGDEVKWRRQETKRVFINCLGTSYHYRNCSPHKIVATLDLNKFVHDMFMIMVNHQYNSYPDNNDNKYAYSPISNAVQYPMQFSAEEIIRVCSSHSSSLILKKLIFFVQESEKTSLLDHMRSIQLKRTKRT